MSDGIRQQTIVHFLRETSAGNRSNFRRPSRWNRIIWNLHYSECGGWRGAIERHVIREFFDRGFGVGCCQVFVERLEEQVQAKSRFVALKLLKCSCDDGSGKAGLIEHLVDPQTIVQLKRCNVQILQRGELYLRLGGEFVAVWR